MVSPARTSLFISPNSKIEMKIYKDSKELPFLIYKKITQTGDFLYLIKGYEDGDEVEADPEKLSLLKADLEDKYNTLITEFVYSLNRSSEELTNHSNYLRAVAQHKVYVLALGIIDYYSDLEKALNAYGQTAVEEILKKLEEEVLFAIKVPRSRDLEQLKQSVIDKIHVYEFNIEKYKSIAEKEETTENEEEIDLDKQFINVCLLLETPFPDESKLTLYQFAVLTGLAIEKSKSLEKLNTRS